MEDTPRRDLVKEFNAAMEASPPEVEDAPQGDSQEARVAALEAQLAALRAEVDGKIDDEAP